MPRHILWHRTRRLLAALTSAIVVVGGLVAAAPAPASADARARGYGSYVALGDSFASFGTATKIHGEPAGCGRATDNYPNDLARSLGVAHFVDASCAGAKTADMASPQRLQPLGENPPQFDALTPDADLVTVTISGNDTLAEILATCLQGSFTNPMGHPCRQHYTAGGTDRAAAMINAVAPKVAGVLDGIHQRSPHATVVLVGYLPLLPPTTGCWPLVPIARGDVPYVHGLWQRMHTMLGAVAGSHNALFSNPGNVLGHDACRPPGAKWTEGLLPTSPSAPLHPNATGQAYVAALTKALLT
ncbi:SGNH/GDSL hydrolase family protein [Streptomyces morookaense]|uniref:SGNH/GDSL hydrolase family protein n=1 Tax=Streptomyces morookaense TaxID=1970 RepID=A0A7Y7EA02_STRMO|nr:SGNH/GDSL hydrolase family protein [Streptomyces morookaense]NVK80957.1 SGNH/GDSL hydrolase family protein [Streptomyces morookaense]GHF40809.1 lipase [Streptomyces morookaense]